MGARVQQISALQAAERVRAGGQSVVLLDCREPEELSISRIDGAAHVAMGDLPSRLPHLDPDAETIVFCHHGVRSMSVARFLMEQGFAQVYSLAGGIDAWSREVDSSVPRY